MLRAPQGVKAERRRKRVESESKNIPSLTISLAAIYLLAYLLVLVGVLDIEALSLDPGAPGAAAFFISPFLHGNLLHVLIVLAFFAVPAVSLERRVGSLGTFLLLAVANLMGSLAWVLVTPSEAPPLIGAVAGVTGLWAAYALFHPRSALTYILLVLWAIAVKVGMPVDGFTSDALSQAGGGIAAGIGFGLFWRFGRGLPEAPAAEDGLVSLIKRLGTSSEGGSRHREAFPGAQELPRRIRLALEADPENIIANQEALDHLLAKGQATGEIVKQGRLLVRLFFKRGDTASAFETYSRLQTRLGNFDLTPDELARLVADRLAKGEWFAADTVLVQLLRLDPANSRLSDFVQRLVRMVLIQRGVAAEPVKRWVAFLDAKYPAHPVTSAVHREMEGTGSGLTNGVELSTDTALPIIPENAATPEKHEAVSFEDELETVRSLLESGETSSAATILSHNQSLIGQFDPFILYTVVEKLMASEDTRLKGVYLLELTIRGHLNHPNTPQLVGALIVLYANELRQPTLARQWLDYMTERWPGDPALSSLQNSVKLSQAHA